MTVQRGNRISPSAAAVSQLERTTREALESLLVDSQPGLTPDDVHVRDLSPDLEFASGADNASAVDTPRFE
jgi:hypothetical protein